MHRLSKLPSLFFVRMCAFYPMIITLCSLNPASAAPIAFNTNNYTLRPCASAVLKVLNDFIAGRFSWGLSSVQSSLWMWSTRALDPVVTSRKGWILNTQLLMRGGAEHSPGITQSVGSTHPPLQGQDALRKHESRNESILANHPHYKGSPLHFFLMHPHLLQPSF